MEDYRYASSILKQSEIIFDFDSLTVNVDFIAMDCFSPGDGYDSHLHSKYEFHYIKSGRGLVEIEGYKYSLQSGDFYVCPPGVIHRQVADEIDPMVEYALKCDLSVHHDRDVRTNEYGRMLKIFNSSSPVVSDTQEMDKLFENIFRESVQGKTGFFMQIKTDIVKILNASARNLSPDNSEYSLQRKDDSKRLELVREYINDNMGKCITCSELAGQLFLSEKQLNRIIRKDTGLTTHQYITKYKLARVKKLLCNPADTLYSIARQTGFSNEFHLSSRFKQYTGFSPSQYRMINNGGDDTIYLHRKES